MCFYVHVQLASVQLKVSQTLGSAVHDIRTKRLGRIQQIDKRRAPEDGVEVATESTL